MLVFLVFLESSSIAPWSRLPGSVLSLMQSSALEERLPAPYRSRPALSHTLMLVLVLSCVQWRSAIDDTLLLAKWILWLIFLFWTLVYRHAVIMGRRKGKHLTIWVFLVFWAAMMQPVAGSEVSEVANHFAADLPASGGKQSSALEAQTSSLTDDEQAHRARSYEPEATNPSPYEHRRRLGGGTVTVSSGLFSSEVSWAVECDDGTSISGGAPYAGSLTIAGGSVCTLSMADSFGDGWNGAEWEYDGHSFTLITGSSGSETFSIPLSPPLPPPRLPPLPPLPPSSPSPPSRPSPPSLPPYPPGTWVVQPGAGTLQAALDNAADGDILVLKDGIYTGSGSNVLEISKSITIRAQHGGQAVLDGENARLVVTIYSGTISLEGLNVTKGSVSACNL